MNNDISTNLTLVDTLSDSINRDIDDVKENLGLLITDRRGIDIYNDLGNVMQILEQIEKMEIRIGLAAKDIRKELED